MRITVMLAAAGTTLVAAGGLFGQTLHRAAAQVGLRRQGRRAIDAMRTFDDRLLADIGVDRASLGFAACHGRLPKRQMPAGIRAGNVVDFGRRSRRVA